MTCTFCEYPLAPDQAEYLPCPPTRTPDPVCPDCWVDRGQDIQDAHDREALFEYRVDVLSGYHD